MCYKKISLVKVLWRSQEVEEASWELESEMQKKHPHLFNKLDGEQESQEESHFEEVGLPETQA